MKNPFRYIFKKENQERKTPSETNTVQGNIKLPPVRSKNIFTDFKYFLFKKPIVNTLITFATEEERQQYCDSIKQRINIDVENYKMLNIHRIEVDTPPRYLFEEILKWNGKSICWPNHIAKVNLHDNKLEKIQIYLFGQTIDNFKLKKKIFTLRIFHLFDLNSIRIQKVPSKNDVDNARYLLYKCQGGYPIGVFSMFIRSSISERGEGDKSQLFIIVSFNFWGKKSISNIKFIQKLWETIHNRVTSHIAIRFKQLTEWNFENFSNGN